MRTPGTAPQAITRAMASQPSETDAYTHASGTCAASGSSRSKYSSQTGWSPLARAFLDVIGTAMFVPEATSGTSEVR